MCVLLKQITLHRYGNGLGERESPACSFRTLVSFQEGVCSFSSQVHLAQRLPRKNVQSDRPGFRLLSLLPLYRLAKL